MSCSGYSSGPKAPKLEADHLRQQFLITLGGIEFDFLKTDWENSSLDPKWMNFSDGELKSALRLIQQAKSSGTIETVGSHGYANALKPTGSNKSGPTTDVQPTDPHMANIVSLLGDLTANSAKIEKRLEALEKTPKASETPTKYCFTHGLNFSHTSKECIRRCQDHKEDATNRNRMGGSDKIAKRRE